VPLRGHDRELDHVLVTITTTDGLTGRGEATVLPGPGAETVETILADVAALPAVLGDAGTAGAEAARAAIALYRPGARSAAAAIDQACHDIAARRLGVPAWRLLGEWRNAGTTCTWAIPATGAENAVAARRAEGYRTFRLGVGADDEADLARVRRLREALGPDARIRVDAGGAYSAERALRAVERLMAHDLELVEQPCAAADLAGMARLRRSLGVRVLADESVASSADAARVAEAGAADCVSINVQRLGGLGPALAVAELVAAAGLGCVVGGSLEVGPGAAAGVHLGVVCPAVAGDSDLLAGVQAAGPNPLSNGLLGAGPRLGEPSGAGLGWTW
jgi:L-Ala-D/L-Glu epimerase